MIEWRSISTDRTLSRASIPWPCLETNLDILPLRRPPASSDNPSTVWSSRLKTRNVSVFLPFFLREALIRHANACNTRSQPAGLAPLLVPGPLYGKASITLKLDGLKTKTNFHPVLNFALFWKVRKYKIKYRTKICDLKSIRCCLSKSSCWCIDFTFIFKSVEGVSSSKNLFTLVCWSP